MKKILDTDVLIIDEVSMVDLPLMNALLKAVLPGTRLIWWETKTSCPAWDPEASLRISLNPAASLW